MLSDFHTKPLQGNQFKVLRAGILNLGGNHSNGSTEAQECVGKGDVVDSVNHHDQDQLASKKVNACSQPFDEWKQEDMLQDVE